MINNILLVETHLHLVALYAAPDIRWLDGSVPSPMRLFSALSFSSLWQPSSAGPDTPVNRLSLITSLVSDGACRSRGNDVMTLLHSNHIILLLVRSQSRASRCIGIVLCFPWVFHLTVTRPGGRVTSAADRDLLEMH